MHGVTAVSFTSLVFASSLVVITLFFSYWQKLRLNKEIIVSVLRAVVQLVAVGYVLELIFSLQSPWFTSLLVLFMIFNAGLNAAKRGKALPHSLWISLLAIFSGTVTTLAILLISGTIHYVAYQIIPIAGMIIGNAMVALGLCYKHLLNDFHTRRAEIEVKLALGADVLPASLPIVREAIRTGMIPTIDSAKTLGIVTLPGMMTGLILAGSSPMMAIKCQIMVTFMLMSTTAIASFIACYLAYRGFFNRQKQLI
ncbi:MAG: iron export ABC transporter permease subunit FetB [Burkholderiales bacterium]|nr:iron export ABC transporter permease subunit FetB [Burkholderiales bacterium]